MSDLEFEALWAHLVWKKYHDPANPLTEHERLFYAANWLRGSVPRSGLIGTFENSTGDEIREAHAALRIMKLDRALALLQRAENLILGDRPLPSGSTQNEIFAKDLSVEELEKVSDALDMVLRPIEGSFGELDGDIFEALCNFADQHDLSGPAG